jgi:two-component system sensor histidine kinase ChvG
VNERRGFRFTIRAKLLLASLSLLVVPWLGYQYIQALEAYLRQAQEEKLLERVSLVASLMHGQPELFHVQPGPATTIDSHIYVRPLHSPIQLDGYADDWSVYDDRRLPLGSVNPGDDLNVTYRFGVLNDYLYVIFDVKDDHVVYRQPNSLHLDRSDHLRIGIQDPGGKYKRYRLTTIAPGWVNAYRMSKTSGKMLPLQPEFRIKGEWQEVAGGYNIEIRIPVEMIGGRLSFAIADVDDAATREVEALAANGDTERRDGLGSIVIPSAQMEALLQRLQKPLNRIWVIDPEYRVIGMAGSLVQADDSADAYMRESGAAGQERSIVQAFYRLVLDQPGNGFRDRLSSASRLDDPAVKAALTGKAEASRRQTADEKISVITAAHPVYVGDKLAGAVAIEETSDSILILQNRAIEALVNLSVLAFLLTIGVLLLFATRLSLRVRRLRNEVDASIAPDGRVQGSIRFFRAGDELGDLGRSFHNMHQRLAQYNRYLETMASKLAHELRTPITIVRSSLDNLSVERPDEKTRTYLDRAHDGIDRLSGILGRMSEATHLEQTIQQEEAQRFAPHIVVKSCVDGYRLAHPQRLIDFVSDNAAETAEITGSAELLAQLLDKLVSNALDFAIPDTVISIALERQGNKLILSVANEGPELPQEMRDNLFDSMVSMRQGKTEQPHLGLGLYIARLIADYHHAHVEVANLASRQGVIFRVIFPLP